MQHPTDKTSKMLLTTEAELFDKLIDKEDPFRKLEKIIDFDELTEPLRQCYSDLGGENFRAIIIFYKIVMLGFEKETRQILAFKFYRIIGNDRFADDQRPEGDVVGDDFISFCFGVETY